jgi:ribosomal protein L40E
MAESTKSSRRVPADEPTTATAERNDGDAIERVLGRVVAVGIPSVAIAGAAIVGAVSNVGSALLVLASGALLGTVALLWASLRTLSGDAPLPADLDGQVARTGLIDPLEERKHRVLRALKDLEAERALGKIDSSDYEEIVGRYRSEAKEILRDIDEKAAPARAEAEKMAAAYLAQHSQTEEASAPAPAPPPAPAPIARMTVPTRIACAQCGESNEPDAAFCKKCGSNVRARANEKDADATG